MKSNRDGGSLSLAVCITTRNRPEIFRKSLNHWLENMPAGGELIVVDDASEVPVPESNYRFSTNVGIARAKNKCLELAQYYDHIFLADDDTYPLSPNWYEPYVESKEPHLMYLFDKWSNGELVGDDSVIYQDKEIEAHSHARGCFLYVHKQVLETVGGYDVRYGDAMHEHLDYSNRIHNAGLTTFPYMDVPNSSKLLYSMDEHQEVSSSIPRATRVAHLKANNALLHASSSSSAFMPYGRDVVIACYFAGVEDVQRGKSWEADYGAVKKLRDSVESQGIEFVLIHNCFNLPNKVDITSSPYFERWLKEWQYLRDNPDIGNVFLVDSTDVDMIRNPFPHVKPGVLYVGDEPGNKLNNGWMLTRHREPSVNGYLRMNGRKPLLNCGVVGGDRSTVMKLCRDIYKYHFSNPLDQTEMGIFNKLLHSKYAGRIEYGRHVTSLFKKYEQKPVSWFRHK